MIADYQRRNEDDQRALGWGKAALLAGAWVFGGSVIFFPLLHWQGDMFLRQDWTVPSFSTAELLQSELSIVAVITACLLGRRYRSWRFVLLFVCLSVIAVYGFAISLFGK